MEKLNVAIADDNERMVQLLDEIVASDKDLQVVGTAKNGVEAYEIIKHKQPDVVLLDIVMPKLDGLALLEKVKKDKSIRKCPSFIIISAVGQDRITEDAFNLGADYYIMKPFDNDMIINRIKSTRVLRGNQYAAGSFRDRGIRNLACRYGADRLSFENDRRCKE